MRYVFAARRRRLGTAEEAGRPPPIDDSFPREKMSFYNQFPPSGKDFFAYHQSAFFSFLQGHYWPCKWKPLSIFQFSKNPKKRYIVKRVTVLKGLVNQKLSRNSVILRENLIV